MLRTLPWDREHLLNGDRSTSCILPIPMAGSKVISKSRYDCLFGSTFLPTLTFVRITGPIGVIL
jgi:hypothetical protein